jgi:hypothetical protein
MGKKKAVDDNGNPLELPDDAVKVRFLRVWSADRGYFAVGQEAELPEEIAESLMGYGVVEVL